MAIIAVLIAGAYIGINVGLNYGGNITGLFYTGSDTPLPPQLSLDHTWRVRDSKGYDGQFYHLIAHDPLLLRGSQSYVDNPQLRWRRIGVPGLAALISFGSDRYVDLGYVAIELLFVFAGTWWLACLNPAWGLAFLLIPGVLVSLDRMTVDLVLAALCVGLIRYSETGGWRAYCILCFAPLVRETGMLLILSWCIWSLLHRRSRPLITGAACALPAAVWWSYVHSRTPSDATPWLSPFPFSGLIERTVSGELGPATTAWLKTAVATEVLALAGIWIAVTCGVYLALRRRWGLAEIATILFTAFVSLLGKRDIWDSAYAIGRTMSPLLAFLMLIGIRDRRFVFITPILLVLPRIALQYEAQLVAAFRLIK